MPCVGPLTSQLGTIFINIGTITRLYPFYFLSTEPSNRLCQVCDVSLGFTGVPQSVHEGDSKRRYSLRCQRITERHLVSYSESKSTCKLFTHVTLDCTAAITDGQLMNENDIIQVMHSNNESGLNEMVNNGSTTSAPSPALETNAAQLSSVTNALSYSELTGTTTAAGLETTPTSNSTSTAVPSSSTTDSTLLPSAHTRMVALPSIHKMALMRRFTLLHGLWSGWSRCESSPCYRLIPDIATNRLFQIKIFRGQCVRQKCCLLFEFFL